MFGRSFRPIQNDKLHIFLQVGEAVPGLEPRKLVLPDEQKKFGIAISAAQFFDRIDRVGGRWPALFQIVHGKTRLAPDRRFQHRAAQRGKRRRGFDFMRRQSGGNEDN